MIESVDFLRFRGFERLTAGLMPHAYIVGPNSAGKSTLLEAIGLAERCLRIARRRTATLRVVRDGQHRNAFPLPSALDNEEDPVRHDFGRDETRASVQWTSGAWIHMVWPKEAQREERGFFYIEVARGLQTRNTKGIRELFDPVTIIPVVTPLERSEELKNPAYVELHSDSRLASRHFRNHLLHLSRGPDWPVFKEFCRPWLPEIELLDASYNLEANKLAVFYREPGSRIPKELAWAGDGIQIWVQLLWHLFRTKGATTIVMDEPEVYLHPDLQRRLVRLLDTLGAQIIMASHSTDVISEAPPEGVLWVDRRLGGARRATTPSVLAALSASLGSSYSLALARSMRSRLVIATDAEDGRILRSLAKQVGAIQLMDEQAVSLIQLRDVGRWATTSQLGEALRSVLPTKVPAVIVLQAGFRAAAANRQIVLRFSAAGVPCKCLARTELENYLLDAETIARLSGAPLAAVTQRLEEIAASLSGVTRGGFIAERVGNAPQGLGSSVLAEAESSFDEIWKDRRARLEIVPGKRVIQEVSLWLGSSGYRAVTGDSLAKAIRPQSIAVDLLRLLLELEDLVAGRDE